MMVTLDDLAGGTFVERKGERQRPIRSAHLADVNGEQVAVLVADDNGREYVMRYLHWVYPRDEDA